MKLLIKKQQNIDEEIENNFSGKDMLDIANEFNDNFNSQVSELKKKYKKENENYNRGVFSNQLNKNKKQNRKLIKKSMYIEKANEIEIQKLIMNLNNTKATGYDNIQAEHYKTNKGSYFRSDIYFN